MTATTVNVNAVVDEAKFKPFHLKIVLWCVFVVIFDGYDLAINGVALPLLMQEWNMTAVQAGMLASTALAGMMFGAMLFGMLADKIGRKNVILICVTLFSGFTFWGGFASGPTEFGILRFIAGLGIGGVLPNLVALTSEYAPQKMRSTLVTTMFSGYAVGGIMAALLGAWFTPSFGWEIMFYIAGIPLLMLPILYLYLPESLTFLVKKQQNEKASKIVQQISPEQNVTASTQFVLNEVHAPDASIAALFKQGRSMSTLLFWCCFFMCLLMVYALGSWLPKLMMAAGYSLGNSLMFLMAMNIGAVVGTIGGGILADRFHLKPVIIGMFLLGAVSLVGLGFNSPQAVIYLLVAAAGASAIGSSILLYSFVAQYYPLAIRSTGIGCASAVGRVGAIVGPIIIGFLLGMELPHKMNFLAVAIPAIIGAISVAMIVRKDLNAERNAETLLAKQKLNSIKT
ncbi:MFS transporter [Acinetobacter variabilis]|uniref:MFS transporter n=2 Tax=Acinetobacter variabilis TaxID=70346 RepID=A0A811ARC8_9GAMM|nr:MULTISPECIES: MFS transporter [Acinetobacter]MBO3660803.1 MFS transporter [Acinetobacter variabilis]MCU4365755.1 MFS transporter [Acinetobacter variabilis]MCU4375558.1 MFS transporter [Acinetobacter variabilis]QKW81609.1 MFS transporter [Acinetobacter sp. FDAARGOS_724]QQN88099.1 MFS transporter [Acinetobacter variabilis]